MPREAASFDPHGSQDRERSGFRFNPAGVMPVEIRLVDTGPGFPLEPYFDDVQLEYNANPGDMNGDCVVNFADILVILGDWGCEGECEGDANGDGVVNFQDILLVLANWS